MDKSSVVTEHAKQHGLKVLDQPLSTDIHEDDLQGIPVIFSTESSNVNMIQYGIERLKK